MMSHRTFHSHNPQTVSGGRRSHILLAFRFPFEFGNNKKGRSVIKEQLMELIEPLQRGAIASEVDKMEVDDLARKLEALNPTTKPLASPLLNGSWELRYTTSASILGLSKPPPFRPFGKICQVLDGNTLTARNIESAPFYNQVSAELTPVSVNKVAVQFKEFRIFNLFAVKAPASAQGELTVTYLDEDLRISRGDKGNLFILTMDDPNKTP
ncbi:hypothetical protein CEUSTIGMA_g12359.t1 [Chlamydomonas eustigma]|uniref:Plastid lipid-associated protein/fibrillin conserved domain-containing protein n=1 Tax=Chlamydomonas eustigma TaxID=1157962 RepID=A0A250XPF6_9CHLO|nr:hypothetical protein CEUSTIGMA_g12359.t1 [Chlamydomonas eustigma]|eukprot:GAX84938.1 hypothetical protein CEUSTIGMA_g12359.t1 [Chlamydomonas eustigma]